MNITNLLQILSEDRSIEYINNTLKGKVPDSVLKTLSSLMKGSKYNPTAMMMINKIQEWEDDKYSNENKRRNLEFIKKRPKLVYAALREAARGSSSYDPETALDHFYYGGQEPIKYWSSFRSSKMAEKEEKPEKDDLGLKGVKPIETKDAFLFIPRGFKEDENGFRVADLEKQHEELRKLSQQMAKKDTSGEKGADVNHWCVAAESDNYFRNERYKGSNKGGIFIIIVKKNEDGSPNWNERYLYWNKGPENEESMWVSPQDEFADKFDRHVSIDQALPKSAVEFIEKKILPKLKIPKGEAQNLELLRRVSDAEKVSYTKDGIQKVNTSSPVVRNYLKVLNFLKEAHKYEDGWKEDEEPKKLIAKHLKKGLSSNFKRNIPPTKSKLYTVTTAPGAMDGEWIRITVFKNNQEQSGSFTIPVHNTLAKNIALGDPDRLERYIEQNYGKNSAMMWKYKDLKPNFKSKSYILYDDDPPKGVKDALKNNKYALNIYRDRKFMDSLNDGEVREFFIGPYFKVTVAMGRNTISASSTPWDMDYEEKNETIGDLKDPNILEKVKKAYNKYVAEGSKNVQETS